MPLAKVLTKKELEKGTLKDIVHCRTKVFDNEQ